MAQNNVNALLHICTLILVLTFSQLVKAAEFNIRQIALTGQTAPGGGSFSRFDRVTSNKRGDIFFTADTESGPGLFAIDNLGVSLLSRTVTPAGFIPP